MISWTNSGNSR